MISIPRNCTALSRLLSAAAIATVGLLSSGGAASALTLDTWTLSGPGTTSVGGTTLAPEFSYDLNPAGYGTVTYTAQTTVLDSGFYQFDWDYSGFHAWFAVEAFLKTINPASTLVDVGPANCCSAPSGGFSYTGTEGFAVTAGDVIGFTFGGSNSDANNVLAGTLQVSPVPLPAGGLLLVAALGGLGLARSRRRSQTCTA